ncbi:hypothetical protein ACIQLJ_13690 [Microbacterium sp. NPDC091313]
MFDIFASGARIVTSDVLGDALLDHVRAVTDKGCTDVVEFPGVIGGRAGVASITVGPGIDFAAVHLQADITSDIQGDVLAASVIRRQTREL